MINTIFFDLDGTLLPMDTDAFVAEYFRLIAQEISHIMDKDLIVRSFAECTHYSVTNHQKGMTNADKFYQCMESNYGISRKLLESESQNFYQNIFPKLIYMSKPSDMANKVIKLAISKDILCILASNPLFPKQAMLERVKWAGLDARDFPEVNSFEDMEYAKPNLDYFRHYLNKYDLDPAECMMVGNDMQEDMIAKQLGMTTFYMNEYKIDRGTRKYTIDHIGGFEQLYELIEAL